MIRRNRSQSRKGHSPLFPLLLAGGVIVAIALSRKRRRRSSTSRGRGCGLSELSPHLQSFRHAILGADKGTILRALGPPPATIGRGVPIHDNTWYYPLDRVQRLALAIQFEEDRASQTEVLKSPR
jgi:hypothetical protein